MPPLKNPNPFEKSVRNKANHLQPTHPIASDPSRAMVVMADFKSSFSRFRSFLKEFRSAYWPVFSISFLFFFTGTANKLHGTGCHKADASIFAGIYFSKKIQESALKRSYPVIEPETIHQIANKGFDGLSDEEIDNVYYFLHEENTFLGRKIFYSNQKQALEVAQSTKKRLQPIYKKVEQLYRISKAKSSSEREPLIRGTKKKKSRIKYFQDMVREDQLLEERKKKSQERALYAEALSQVIGLIGGQLISGLIGFPADTSQDILTTLLSETIISSTVEVCILNEWDTKKSLQELASKQQIKKIVRRSVKTVFMHMMSRRYRNPNGASTSKKPVSWGIKEHVKQQALSEIIDYLLDFVEELFERRANYDSLIDWTEFLKKNLRLKERLFNISTRSLLDWCACKLGRKHRDQKNNEAKQPVRRSKRINRAVSYRVNHFMLSGFKSSAQKIGDNLAYNHHVQEQSRQNPMCPLVQKELTNGLKEAFLIGGVGGTAGHFISETFYKFQKPDWLACTDQEKSLEAQYQYNKRLINQAASIGQIGGIFIGYYFGDTCSGTSGASFIIQNDFSKIERERLEGVYLQQRKKRYQARLMKSYADLNYKEIGDDFIKKKWIIRAEKWLDGQTYYLIQVMNKHGDPIIIPYKKLEVAVADYILYHPKIADKIKEARHKYLEKTYRNAIKNLSPKQAEYYLTNCVKKMAKEAQGTKDLLEGRKLLIDMAFYSKKEAEKGFFSKTQYIYDAQIYLNYFLKSQGELDPKATLKEAQTALDKLNHVRSIKNIDQIALLYQIKKCQQLRYKLGLELTILENIRHFSGIKEVSKKQVEAYETVKKLRRVLGVKEDTPPPPPMMELIFSTVNGAKKNIRDTVVGTFNLLVGTLKLNGEINCLLYKKLPIHAYKVCMLCMKQRNETLPKEIMKISLKLLKEDPVFNRVKDLTFYASGVSKGVYKYIKSSSKNPYDYIGDEWLRLEKEKICDIGLHSQDASKWGYYQNKACLKRAEAIGYYVMEGILICFGDEILEACIAGARAGKAILLGERLGQTALELKEVSLLVEVANLKHEQRAEALVALLNKKPHLKPVFDKDIKWTNKLLSNLQKQDKQQKQLLKTIIHKSQKELRKRKGRSTIYEALGGAKQAEKDFKALNPQRVQRIKDGGKVGTLMDGRVVVFREKSSDKLARSTLEIQTGKKRVKIRYKRSNKIELPKTGAYKISQHLFTTSTKPLHKDQEGVAPLFFESLNESSILSR